MDARSLVPALAVALALIPSPAAAGVITGTVRIASAAPAAAGGGNPYPGRAGSLAQASPIERGAVLDAVVFLERIPAAVDSALDAPGAPARLVQKGQAFVPRVVAVPAGATVEFPNLDPIYHNVFSPSPVRRFDLGKYGRGKSRLVAFPRPGVVNVFCDIHSNMEAFVLVLPHRAFTRPDRDGRFRLPELPAGDYVVRAWHPDFREQRREVRVPAAGAVAVDLVF